MSPSNPPASEAPAESAGAGDDLRSLAEVIDHAAHLLPAQGPITVFIHHNTLHAFEDLPFHEAVKKGSQVFGCQPYLTEDRYRTELLRGRIRFSDLREVLIEDLGATASEPVPCFGTRLDLVLAMLQYPLLTGPTEELVWFVAEANALRRIRPEASAADRGRMIAETRRWVIRDLRAGAVPGDGPPNDAARDARVPASLSELLDRFGEARMEAWTEEDWEGFTLQSLWRVCYDGVVGLPAFTPAPPEPVRHRDLIYRVTAVDADVPVHDVLIRYCGAFLDQGFAPWQLPLRDVGFFRSFCTLYAQDRRNPGRWRRGLAEELERMTREGIKPLESIRESLALLGVAAEERDDYLSQTLLALRGWGGMLEQVGIRGDRVVRPIPAGSLVEFLAIRLILDRFALAQAAREGLGYDGPLAELRPFLRARTAPPWPPSAQQRAFQVFQLAQIFGLSPEVLHRLDRDAWAELMSEIESFSSIERRRLFHLAYERRFRTQTLDAVALHAPKADSRPRSPSFQVVCCIDEREESFRRHLEEIEPAVETFGAAGFYSMAMYYKGAADAHFVPLCPAVVRPSHWVVEEVGDDQGRSHRRRAMTRQVLGTASHRFHLGSRSFALGAVLTGTVGVLASFPLVARVLFPRLTARIRRSASRFVQTPPVTHLHLERSSSEPGPGGPGVGFSVEEMADRGERQLRDIGLTDGFARLVIFVGHGSSSLNNPHDSAHNCGACGGSPGGPNARAMAQVLNDPRVRAELSRRGLLIPEETLFVGGYHNTCNESVSFADVNRIPGSHRAVFETARDRIDAALERNAHERCRRFMSAPLSISFRGAHQHVEERSEDLAESRPELGHSTNAITIVGRRQWSRGLYFDRRAFLTSYDPMKDDADDAILARTLAAVFPVCSGISLEYYFSHVDNDGFGSGTKLPHNIASLLGVMDGAASDLRTGLPWQMVDIHEPLRSLFIIETTAGAMTRIMERNAGIGRLCRNGWVQLAVIHPETREVSVFLDGAFRPYTPEVAVLPAAPTSVHWYRGWRDHLEFAEIGASAAPEE